MNQSNGRGGKKKKRVVIILLVVIVLLLAAAGCAYLALFSPADRSSDSVTSFRVEKGAGSGVIASELEEEGLIRSAAGFKIYSRLHGLDTSFQAGTYNLSGKMSVGEICEIISGGKVAEVSVTIPEGLTEYETAQKFADAGVCDYDKLVDVMENTDFSEDYSFLSGAQEGTHRLEGYLFPDTYSVPEGATEEEIVRMMLDEFQSVYKKSYEKKAEALGLTENQVITVASIIEKESGNDADRTKVASVIYNRLEAGMNLQMDSTVAYALKVSGKTANEELSYADLAYDSPYNTYKYSGLPPGPICCPSKASIEAALNPADTDYLYFVLSEKLDGSSGFSHDYETFQKASEAYYAAKEKADAKTSGSQQDD